MTQPMTLLNSLIFLVFLSLTQTMTLAASSNICILLDKRSLGERVLFIDSNIPLAWKYKHRWESYSFVTSVLNNFDKLDEIQSEDLYKHQDLIRKLLFQKITSTIKFGTSSFAMQDNLDKDVQYSAFFLAFYTGILKPLWDAHPLQNQADYVDDDYEAQEDYESDFEIEKTIFGQTHDIVYAEIMNHNQWNLAIQAVKPVQLKATIADELAACGQVPEEKIHLYYELSLLNTPSTWSKVIEDYEKIYKYLLGKKAQKPLLKRYNLKSSISIRIADKSAYPLLEILDHLVNEVG